MFQLEPAPSVPSNPVSPAPSPPKETKEEGEKKKEKKKPNRSIEVFYTFDNIEPVIVDVDFHDPAPQITETYFLTEVWKELTPDERVHLLHISCHQTAQHEEETILPFLQRSGGWYNRKAVQYGAEGLR